MHASKKHKLRGLESPPQNLANSTPVSTSLCAPLSFQASPPHFPKSPSLCSTFHSTVQSSSDFTLDSTVSPETTPVSTPLLFIFCITQHSTLQCTLHSALQSILHPRLLFHLTLQLFPPHFPLTPVPSTPYPFCNGASSVVPAFSANVQEPGQARGWRVSLSHPDHRAACDGDTTTYEHGRPMPHVCLHF